MKKGLVIAVSLFLFAVFKVSAQGQDMNIGGVQLLEKSKTLSERLEEGVRPQNGGRLTLYGELYARGWIGGEKEGMVVQGADLSQDDTFIGLLWEFTNFTGAIFELTSYFDLLTRQGNAPYVYFNKAYLFSDIAGEAGSKNMQAKVSLGMFGFDSDFVSPVDPMGTGDDMQHDDRSDVLNWRLDIGTRGEDIFPINFVIASDLDFGYRQQHSQTDLNNRGVAGMFEIQSYGINIADVVNLSVNAYYTGQFLANLKVTSDLESVTNRTQHSIGGSLGANIAVAEGMSVDVGAAAEYDIWSYGGVDSRVGRTFSALDWQAGAAFVMENQFVVALAMRQDAYNHAEYAKMNNRSPFTEFILGASVHYLGLKELTKLSFYAGVGYSFGSLYSSELYKNAYASGNPMYGGDLNYYAAGSPFSADVGMGYHPTENASIVLGYNYGRYGLEAPDGAERDFKDNWGKVYVKGSYLF